MQPSIEHFPIHITYESFIDHKCLNISSAIEDSYVDVNVQTSK